MKTHSGASQTPARRTSPLFFCLILLLAVIGVVAIISTRKPVDVRPVPKLVEEDVEDYLIRTALPAPVNPRYRQVLIYRYLGPGRAAFTAVGTFIDTAKGPIVVTAEHLLSQEARGGPFIIRMASPLGSASTTGIESIAHRNVDVGLPADWDVVFLKVGELPTILPIISSKSSKVSERGEGHLFDNLEIRGRVVKRLRSLLSGAEYRVLGAATNPQLIIIDYASRSGESGTGFVDEYGQLYVLSGSTRENGPAVSFLCGPFENVERHM